MMRLAIWYGSTNARAEQAFPSSGSTSYSHGTIPTPTYGGRWLWQLRRVFSCSSISPTRWGHSRRTPKELEYLRPHLRPRTALPGERRYVGDDWILPNG